MTTPFVYRIQEVSTGKFYVGVKTANDCTPEMLGRAIRGYWTSCKDITSKWKNDPLSFVILDIIPLNDKDAALELEEFILNIVDAVNSPDYINRSIGGYKFSTTGRTLGEKHKQSLSLHHRGKSISEKHRLAISKANRGIKRHDALTTESVSNKLRGNKNAARCYIFIDPSGVVHKVKGLNEFLNQHELPQKGTISKFLGKGKIPPPDQHRGMKRDNLTGWEVMYEH